jgi:Tfp pilus assembly protein PilO
LPAKKQAQVAIRLAVVLAGLVVLAGAGYFLLVQPKKSQASSLTRKIAELSTQIADSRSQATQAAGLSKILVADFYKLTTAMPDKADVSGVLFQIDAIAKDTGTSFDSITPGQVVDASTYQVLPITLAIQGNFFDLADFVRRLQSLVLVENGKLIARGRLFTVDQITFNEGDSGFPKIKASISVNAYMHGHPVAVTPISGGASTSTTSTSTTTTPSSTEGGVTP